MARQPSAVAILIAAPRTGLCLAAALCLAAPALPAAAQGADTAGTGAALAAFDAACRATAPRLWGPRLCGALVLVQPRTRLVVTNRALPGAGLTAAGTVWIGRLPDSVLVANTAFRWHGVEFAMVMLPLPTDAFDRTALLAHESFHRIQASLGLSRHDSPTPHMDGPDARTWLRLELQALGYALTTSGPTRLRHARSALAFRGERRRLFPAFAAGEDSLEIQEGLAEYTGQVVAAWRSGLGPLRHVRAIDAVTRRPSYVRSFAYATGPALGLVLDSLAPGWRGRVARRGSMSALLEEGLQTTASRDAPGAPERGVVAAAAPYGYAAISAAETARERDRLARLAAFRRALVEGPTLHLPANNTNRSFDPNTLVSMDSLGVAYPMGEFQGPWGRLTVDEGSDGALLSADMMLLRVAAPPSTGGRTVRGKGWSLALAEGWDVAPGERAGDFVVGRRARDCG